MPRLNVNLSEAQSMKPIPEDTYPCTIMEIGEPQTGPKSTYVLVTYVVSEGEYEGRQLFQNLPITGKGAGIFADFYSKVTGEEVDVDELDDLDVDTDDLIGKEIGVVAGQREYPEGSGEFRNEVKKLVRAE
jgi:hypothetical protein